MANDRGYFALALQRILEDGVALSVLKNDVATEDRGYFNMLMMTTLRQLAFIRESVLPRYIKKKIPHKERILTYLLYLGGAELLFMQTPAHAVINLSAEAAKRLAGQFGANFVNAVLRRVDKEKAALCALQNGHYFSRNFRQILKQDYAPEAVKAMEKYAGVEAALDITLKNTADNPLADGVVLPTGSIRLPANTKVSAIPEYAAGKWWVQDAAAALAVKGLGDVRGLKALDLCAAPGGKTAQLLAGGAEVTAVDISESRLATLKENIQRLDLADKLAIVQADALEFTPTSLFDIVLLDAPCSATGTFRRHPEIIHTRTVDDVRRQAALQKELIRKAAQLVTPDGKLVYATCSLAKAEGEVVIRNFIAEQPEFAIVPASIRGTEHSVTKDGFIRILPHTFVTGENTVLSGADGFFIAYLQRKI